MKHPLAFLFFLLAFNSYSQDSIPKMDTLFLKSGDFYTGNLFSEDQMDYNFIIGGRTGNITEVPKRKVLRVSRNVENVIEAKIYENYKIEKESDITKENLLVNVQLMRLQMNDASRSLERAGSWGVASGIFILAGSVISIVGATTGKPVASYFGAGVGGLGMVLSIPAFSNLISAGKAMKKKSRGGEDW
jgi:hypothetical protein